MSESGLTSMSHFVQYFKKKYGRTPSGYRRQPFS
jgi:AraC-like DNA-binding protein